MNALYGQAIAPNPMSELAKHLRNIGSMPMVAEAATGN